MELVMEEGRKLEVLTTLKALKIIRVQTLHFCHSYMPVHTLLRHKAKLIGFL